MLYRTIPRFSPNQPHSHCSLHHCHPIYTSRPQSPCTTNQTPLSIMDSPSSSGTQSPATPITPSEPQVTDAYAFAFDIDGVLVRGGKAIPAALEAMKMLDGANDYGVKV